MTETIQTRDGIDVELRIVPDTPSAWKRLNPVLAHIDRLATAAAHLDPDWQIDIALGWDQTNAVHLTASPATVMDTAA